MSDKDFVLAGDGWVQVTPCGEFPHVGAGVTQVIDREACDRIAAPVGGNGLMVKNIHDFLTNHEGSDKLFTNMGRIVKNAVYPSFAIGRPYHVH